MEQREVLTTVTAAVLTKEQELTGLVEIEMQRMEDDALRAIGFSVRVFS
jgi:hypothetical protein